MSESNNKEDKDKKTPDKRILVVSKDEAKNMAPLAGPGMVEEKPATIIKTGDKKNDSVVVVSNEAKNLAPLAGPEKELDKVEKKVEQKDESDLFKKNDIKKGDDIKKGEDLKKGDDIKKSESHKMVDSHNMKKGDDIKSDSHKMADSHSMKKGDDIKSDSHKMADSHNMKSDSHAMKSDSHAMKSDSHAMKSDSHMKTSDSHMKTSDSHMKTSDSHMKTSDSHKATDSHNMKSDFNKATDSHVDEKKKEGRFVIGSKYSEKEATDKKEGISPAAKAGATAAAVGATGAAAGMAYNKKVDDSSKKVDDPKKVDSKMTDSSKDNKSDNPKSITGNNGSNKANSHVMIDEKKNKQHTMATFIPTKLENPQPESVLSEFRSKNNILAEGAFFKKRSFFFCFWVEKYFILLKTGQLVWIEKDGTGVGSGNWNLKHATAFNKLTYEGCSHPYRLTFSTNESACYFAFNEEKERDYWYDMFQDVSRA